MTIWSRFWTAGSIEKEGQSALRNSCCRISDQILTSVQAPRKDPGSSHKILENDMKIGQPFNTLNLREYFHCIEHHQKYSDFNVLGLYRSIHENKKLSLEERLDVLERANKLFGKTFEFLQLKDPWTYFKLVTLGQDLTIADEVELWREIKSQQQKILKAKKIRHRNFGTYSKHQCGDDNCIYSGLMVRQGSWFAECVMKFDSDRSSYGARAKSELGKKNRKNRHRVVSKEIEEHSDEVDFDYE